MNIAFGIVVLSVLLMTLLFSLFGQFLTDRISWVANFLKTVNLLKGAEITASLLKEPVEIVGERPLKDYLDHSQLPLFPVCHQKKNFYKVLDLTCDKAKSYTNGVLGLRYTALLVFIAGILNILSICGNEKPEGFVSLLTLLGAYALSIFSVLKLLALQQFIFGYLKLLYDIRKLS